MRFTAISRCSCARAYGGRIPGRFRHRRKEVPRSRSGRRSGYRALPYDLRSGLSCSPVIFD